MYLGFPPERWPDQLYVVVISESPSNVAWTAGNAPRFNGFFNLTMSYRRDSDIWFPPFQVEPLRNTVEEQQEKWQQIQVLVLV